MSPEVEKLKEEILPKLTPDLSIELQKSIVQFELKNYKESLELIASTLSKFLIKYYYDKESPISKEKKSITEMIKELKSRNIEIDREISSTLLRIDAKIMDIESADSVILESCIDGCNTIFEVHLKGIESINQVSKIASGEISKYILEEIMDIYNEDSSKDSINSNFTRVKSLIEKYPDNKQIRELYIYLLTFTDKNNLLNEVKAIIANKKYSIRLSAVIIISLAEVKLIDESLFYLDLFEKEYPDEPEIKYAKAFLFINIFINKNKQKDLDKADSILAEVEKKDDPYFNFIFTSHQIVKFNKKEFSEFKALNNKGFFLEKLSSLSKEYEKSLQNQKELELKNAELEKNTTREVINSAQNIAPQPATAPKPEQKKLTEYEILTFNLKDYYKFEFSLIKDSGGTYNGKFNWSAFLFTWMWGLVVGLGFPKISVIQLVSSLIIGAIYGATDNGFWAFMSYACSFGWGYYWGKKGNYFYYNKLINKIDV